MTTRMVNTRVDMPASVLQKTLQPTLSDFSGDFFTELFQRAYLGRRSSCLGFWHVLNLAFDVKTPRRVYTLLLVHLAFGGFMTTLLSPPIRMNIEYIVRYYAYGCRQTNIVINLSP